MTPINVTDGTSQPITAAGATAPTAGLAIATLSGPYEISIEILSFTTTSGAGHVRITCEDTVNAFSAAIPVAEWEFAVTGPQGQIGSAGAASIAESKTMAEAPGLRIGVTSAAMRFNVVEIDGTGASLQYTGRLWN